MPDPKPPTRSRTPGVPGVPRIGLNPGSKLGILALIGFFVLVVVGWFSLGTMGGGGSRTASPQPADGPDLMPRDPRIERIDDAGLAEAVPEESRRRLEEELRTWFHAEDRRPIMDTEPTDESEWVEKLLSPEIRNRVDRLPDRVFGTLENIPKVLDEPAPYRGRLVEVWGVVSFDEVDDGRQHYLLQVEDRNATMWTIDASVAPPPEVAPGAWVKATGVFVKLRPLPGASRPALHVFSTRPLRRTFEPTTVRERDPAWLEQVRDATVEESRTLQEDAAFWGMLNYVRTLGPKGYQELRDTGELEPIDLTSTKGATELADRPAPYRLRLVRLRAAPIRKEFVVDEDLPENPGNIDWVYRGFVVDDQMRAVWFITPFPPSTFELTGTRVAAVEGFFYKRQAVESRTGKAYWMPVLIGTAIEPIVSEAEPVTRADPRVAVGIVVVGSVFLIGLFVFLVFRNRRQQEEVRRRVAERRSRAEGRA